jgi:hypothetical protein
MHYFTPWLTAINCPSSPDWPEPNLSPPSMNRASLWKTWSQQSMSCTNTTPDGNDGLRKHVVYRAQSHMQQLKKLDSFKEIYEKYIGFSWDFGTKYQACRTVWCAACLHESKLPAGCQCGFNGLCENTKTCNELDWASLKCTSCKRTGQLIRDEPNDDDEIAITGTAKSKSVQGSPDGCEMRNKKKKSLR